MDIQHQIEIMELVQKLNKETGIGIVMVLHDISRAFGSKQPSCCDERWKKICAWYSSEVITPEMLRDVYGVESELFQLKADAAPLYVMTDCAI